MYGSSPIEQMAFEAMVQGLIFCDAFTYSASWQTGTSTALAANGSTDVQIQVNSDSDFVIQELNFQAWTAAGTIIAAPDYLLTLINSGSGRQIMNQAQPITTLAGAFFNANGPGKMPMPKIVTANTTITCTLQNRTGTANNRADLALRGFKVFYTGGDRGTIFHIA